MRLLTAFLSLAAEATYFYIPEGEEKCFVETVPAGLYATVTYEALDPPGDPCLVEFRVVKKVLFSKGVDKNSLRGVTSYHVNEALVKQYSPAGDSLEVLVCLVCKGGKQHWWEAHAERLRWQVKIELLYDPLLANSVMTEDTHESFSASETKIKNLLSRFESIYAENEYERKQEEFFRDTSEQVNAGVVRLNLIEMILIFVVTIFQVYHLRNYFRQQKLI